MYSSFTGTLGNSQTCRLTPWSHWPLSAWFPWSYDRRRSSPLGSSGWWWAFLQHPHSLFDECPPWQTKTNTMRPYLYTSMPQHIKPASKNTPRDSGLLGLCLLGDIFDGEALLADDGSHILSRHDDAQVLLCCARSTKFSWGPGLWVTLIPWQSTSASCTGSLIGRSSVHVCNIRHLERVVVKLVSR